MKLTAEQAERLCAFFAANALVGGCDEVSEGYAYSEVTFESGDPCYSPGKVQELIRRFVDSKDNI